ncbi:MAG TPA: GMC family oxidoreductase [Solirubrobacteraceae bacterium]|nr:GMC family oxidoreductase [Solirubrobacteraceae bacterium]
MSPEHFDAVIVGSGFGGSVMAHRLAEGGLDVCLLERGRAYPPGSFPRSPHAMRTNFWDPGERLYGMFDLWSFKGLEAVVSSGLGGGSLIYANVLLRKDERWFGDDGPDGYEPWPITRADLDPHYDRVEAMIAPQRYPFDHEPYASTPKTVAFKGAADRLGLDFQFPPLAVTFANNGRPPAPGERIEEHEPNLHGLPRQTCHLVGECDIGCNWGAKNSLDFNYLSAAKRAGAELRTSAEVKDFEPIASGGYRVSYVTHPDGARHAITTRRLVLSAGTLGSTFLLLRNRNRFPGRLGDQLGKRFCGNGDLLTFAMRCRELIEPARGPVITGAIRYPDLLDRTGEDGRGFYIEDAGVPEFATWMVQASEAPATSLRAAKMLLLVLRQRLRGTPESNLSAEVSALFDEEGSASRFLPLLGMGRDIPDGTMTLSKRGYLDVDWTTKTSAAFFDRVRSESKRLAEELGARRFVDNPIWHLRHVISVHPLGGCPMGRSASDGVVDPYGQVYGQPGLYVADGSVVPGPVGANPSLTIAALADRFADGILEQRPAAPARRGVATRGHDAVSLSFTEEMKGFVALGERDYEQGYRAGRQQRRALMFHLTITAPDVERFIADPEHEGVAEGYIVCEALGGRRAVQRGVFNLFVDQQGDRPVKHMLYHLPFSDADGRALTMVGFKRVGDHPGLDVWQDTTTLFTRILPGHPEPGEEAGAEPLAAGIIHIHARDFARQLTTFRVDPPHRVDALGRFAALFAGALWQVYGPRAKG